MNSPLWPLQTSIKGLVIDWNSYEFLRELSHKGPHRLKDLAAAANVTVPQASRLVETMVKQKLLVQSTPDDDRRVTIIDLTRRGRSVFEEIEDLFSGLMRDRVGCMTDDEVRVFARLYEKFADEVTRWSDSFDGS
ncbi:MarR family winged helix-turn-helix transcriptional regulator [Nocardioides sp. Bht2]|uniref:MarR family winged helix-turn-helix transcriptional regulator n=1 Tax=Nocardioides sp. Bht2 TaxID=3392297 RepID=UPI0039B3C799